MKTPSAPPPPLSPRDYAAAILAEASRERRVALLQACPEHWRERVKGHVQRAFACVKAYRQMMANRARSISQGPQAAPRREDTSFRISAYTKSSPEVGNAHLEALRTTLMREEVPDA